MFEKPSSSCDMLTFPPVCQLSCKGNLRWFKDMDLPVVKFDVGQAVGCNEADDGSKEISDNQFIIYPEGECLYHAHTLAAALR